MSKSSNETKKTTTEPKPKSNPAEELKVEELEDRIAPMKTRF
jgi:hypothetical protein